MDLKRRSNLERFFHEGLFLFCFAIRPLVLGVADMQAVRVLQARVYVLQPLTRKVVP